MRETGYYTKKLHKIKENNMQMTQDTFRVVWFQMKTQSTQKEKGFVNYSLLWD